MAGNALTAAMFSVGKGNTGVGKPTETLSSIDKGIKDVGTWAKGIEDEKQKLKTDTAKKYREAELKAYENMPSNETEKANMIKGLASYKDQLYMNMKLVQNGNIDSKDNLIFQENGKQSFDILSQVIKNYGEERDLTMKRAKGYTDKDGTVVPPTAGGVEAALQDLQSRLGNPQFSEITFDEKGMGGVTFFETEIDEETDTRVIKRDAKGEPIIQKGMGSLSVLAFNKGRNQRAERVYLDKAAQGFIGEETALGQAYQIMEGINKGMVGNVTDDQRQKSRNQLNQLLDQAASTITSSNDSVSSILSDNGPLEERSTPINSIQAEELKSSGVNLDEQISYTYIDSAGKTQTGQKSKYIIQKVSQNNQIVSVLSAEDKQAAVNMAKSQLYSQLGRKVDAGTAVKTFDQNTPQKLSNKTQVDKGVRTVAALNNLRGAKTSQEMELALQEMQGLSGLKYDSIKEKTDTIIGSDGNPKEIVTEVILNLGGKDIPFKFGEVVEENGKKVFKETSASDFINANYEYINAGGVSSDIALSKFKGKLFDNVSQTGTGTRVKKYGSTKQLSITQTYKVGEDKTTLKDELQTVFENADSVSSFDLGQNMSNLVGGVKETMLSAYGALGLDVPEGFEVKNDGNDLIIQGKDSEGITVIKKIKKIGNASDEGYQELQGAVAEFINKIK